MKNIILGVLVLVIVLGGYVIYQLQKDDNQLLQAPIDEYEIGISWDSTVEEYLLSQKDFVWQTEENSQIACVFEKLEETYDLFPMAIWAYCLEYKMDNRKIKELSGSSGPALLEYPIQISYLDMSHFTHQKPGDGSLYAQDIKKMFSGKTQKVILSYSLNNVLKNKMNEKINLSITEKEPVLDIGAGVDPDYPDQVVCTQEAKSCGDGTYVGRTGPNCEFAKCPGRTPTPDFIPTPGSPIQLPANVISEKDCVAAGGEVWNTLGETGYDGELIGRVEGLKCPCACLVK